MTREELEQRVNELTQEIVMIDENRRAETARREILVRERNNAKAELDALGNPTETAH